MGIKVECAVKQNIDVNGLLEDMGFDKRMSFLAFTADTAYKMMDSFVPMSDGYLTSEGFVQPGRLRKDHKIYQDGDHYVIHYRAPYSRYQYYGVRADGSHRVHNYTTPGTGPYWDKAMITARGDEFIEQLEDFIEKRLK